MFIKCDIYYYLIVYYIEGSKIILTIDNFLVECKKRVNKNNLDFVPVRKNVVTRRKYAFTIHDIEDKIPCLCSSDLHKGPEVDRDYPTEELWIFKKIIGGTMFYIKLKLRSTSDEVVCISFHEDE